MLYLRGRPSLHPGPIGSAATALGRYEALEARELLSAVPPATIADPAATNGAYVQAVYQDVLRQPADSSAQAWWVALLDAGQSRSLLTNAIAGCEQHLSDVVASAYETYLARPPENAALGYWINLMHAGMRDEVVEATLVASDEFYANAGGTASGWIQAAYQAVLGRAADSDDLAWATTQLNSGASRGDLATMLTMSEEHQAQFVDQELVQKLQLTFASSGTQFFSDELATGQVTREQLTASLMADAQYYEVHTGVPVTLVPVPNTLPWFGQDFAQISSQASQGDANVLFLGDSITQSWLGKGGTPAWNQNFAPLGSLNAGIAGDSTENILWRLQHGNLNGISPKVAVVMAGVNDLGEGASPGDIAAGITAIVQTLRIEFPTTKILLLGLLPGLQTDPNSVFRQEIAQVNQLIEPLADGQHVWYLDLTPYFVNPDGSTNQSLYLTDHTHPNAQGYNIMALAIAPWVRALSA